jgi:hypothetical protein
MNIIINNITKGEVSRKKEITFSLFFTLVGVTLCVFIFLFDSVKEIMKKKQLKIIKMKCFCFYKLRNNF